MNEMDAALVGRGASDEARDRDRLRKSWWKRVASIKVALILLADGGDGGAVGPPVLHAFGAAYSQAGGDADVGTRLDRNAMD
ncbi:hypothetical protein, partial [Pseudomonas sp. GW460-13]|uniref:hypothetical protein n=1 Tax=Pseudomonas sp. GW460-13 TaxID=2070590 RepID=UPI000CBE6634